MRNNTSWHDNSWKKVINQKSRKIFIRLGTGWTFGKININITSNYTGGWLRSNCTQTFLQFFSELINTVARMTIYSSYDKFFLVFCRLSQIFSTLTVGYLYNLYVATHVAEWQTKWHNPSDLGVMSGEFGGHMSGATKYAVVRHSRDGRYSRYPRYTAVPNFTVPVPWGSRYTVEVTVLHGTI